MPVMPKQGRPPLYRIVVTAFSSDKSLAKSAAEEAPNRNTDWDVV